MDELLIAFVLFVILVVSILVAHTTGRRETVLTPLVLYAGIEVFSVWPTLLPGVVQGNVIRSYIPIMTAATALLAFVVAYTVFGGGRASVKQWRGDESRPELAVLKRLRIGSFLWILILVAIGIYRFGGPPPLLSGGLGGLIDPVANSGQVDSIRETRRELTKGHLVLQQQYAGQGIFNALSETGWQLAVVTATLLASWSRTRRSVIEAVAVGLLAFIFLGSTGVRSAIVMAAVGAAAVLAVRYRPKARHLTSAGLGILGVLLFIMPLTKGESAGTGLGSRALAALTRISEGNGQNNAFIVNLVDRGSLDLGWGSLFVERFFAMLPGPDGGVPFGLRLTRLVYGGGANVSGYSTPTQYGLLYAEGGVVAVIVGYAMAGVLVALLWRRLSRVTVWYGPILLAQGGIILAYVSVTGVHGLPPAAGMVAIGIFVINSGHSLHRLNTSRGARMPSKLSNRMRGVTRL